MMDGRHHGESQRLSGPGLRTFLEIADQIGLSQADQRAVLGQPDEATYTAWIERARAGDELALEADMLTRLSYVLGIWRALETVFPRGDEARCWLHSANDGPAFGGHAPRDLLVSGDMDDLARLRRHLDAWAAGAL